MRPIEIACRRCAQQPRERCILIDSPVPTFSTIFHAERIEDAAAMSGTDDISEAEFDHAVDESGLV